MSDASRFANLLERLSATLGPDRLVLADSGPTSYVDLCGYALGRPAAWVQPRDTAEVARLVVLARATGVPIVPVGARTSYWRPLDLEGAIAVDLARLDHIETPDIEGGFVSCGAGSHVQRIDDALRARGALLPCFPDAFGDTSIGAMVATGFASGIGAASAPLGATVLGLRVVLGTGEVLTTGTGHTLGATPFTRAGLPDPTELFFASDGALGIVTEVVVRALPRAPLAQLTWSGPAGRAGLRTAIDLARRLRAPGLYETFRAVTIFSRPEDRSSARPTSPGTLDGQDANWSASEMDIALVAPLGVPELDARSRTVAALVASLLPGAQLSERREIPGEPGRIPFRSFRGASPGEHWRQLSQIRFVGVDVVTSYPDIDACLDAADVISRDAAKIPGFRAARSALYFTPEFVNLGLHFELRLGQDTLEAAHELVRGSIRHLAPLRVVPYRWGRLWGAAAESKVDPIYRSLLDAVKKRCDPDGILHPGASLFRRE